MTVLLGLAMTAGHASAASKQGALTVQATVLSSCSVNDAALNFGTIDPALGSLLPATTLINVTCTLGTGFSVGLANGSNASSGQRRMHSTTSDNYLNYELYKDLTTSQRFGDTVTAERVTALTGLGIAPNPVSVYAVVPPGQAAGTGVYTDNVLITVYY